MSGSKPSINPPTKVDVREFQAKLDTIQSADSAYIRNVFEVLPFGLAVFDEKLHLQHANQLFFELLDLPDYLAAPGTPLITLFRFNAERGEYGRHNVAEKVAKRLALARQCTPQKLERTRPDGTVLQIVSTPIPTGGFVSTYTDVTEAKKTSAALVDSEEKYRSIFEAESDAIIVADSQSLNIFEVNGAACELYQYTRRQLRAMRLIELSGEYENSERRLRNVISNGQLLRSEGVHRKSDGSLFHIELTMSMCTLAEKSLLVAVVRDMTEHVRIQEELSQHRDNLQVLVESQTGDLIKARNAAESANRAKTEFLANMSHELRTPLHAILSFSELTVRQIEKQKFDKAQQHLVRIRNSGKQLLSFVNDLLDMSKAEAGKMTYRMSTKIVTETVALVVDELAPLAADKGITLRVQSGNHPEYVRFDPIRLAQVLRNLLSNAIKFTPRQRCVRVVLGCGFVAGRRRADKLRRPAVEIRVIDEGEGIPEGELESVFDKFVQSSQTNSGSGGTGLGLSICREIVKAHGGLIQAERNSTAGMSFVVTIPVDGPLS